MLILLFIFSTKIHQTEGRPCSERSVNEICASPGECPLDFGKFRELCVGGSASGPAQMLGRTEAAEPTPEIVTSTLSSGVVTFPRMTFSAQNLVTEEKVTHCLRTGCPEPKVCDKKKGDCICPNLCQSLYPRWDPICGSDCKVYFSMCHFQTQQCYAHPGVFNMFRRGFCPPRINPRVKITEGESRKTVNNMSVVEGVTVSLSCHVVSSQHHVITWRRTDHGGNVHTLDYQQVVTSTTTLHNRVTSVSVLRLLDFSETQVGLYTCRAEMCGAEKSHTVLVEEKRNKPTCSILGASLVSSFDGLIYRSRFKGDFILAMDRQSSRWYVLGRFRPCFETDYCLYSVTVHDSVSGMSMYRGGRIHGDKLWKELLVGEEVTREYKTAFRRGNRTVIVLYQGDVVVQWDNMMGVHVTVLRGRDVKTGGLCGNNDKNSENDLLPRYQRYDANFADYLRSWRISNHRSDPMGSEPIFERDFALNEPSEKLETCQNLLKELLETLKCTPDKGQLKLLVWNCVEEQGESFKRRRDCDVRCYLTLQLDIMCNPALGPEH